MRSFKTVKLVLTVYEKCREELSRKHIVFYIVGRYDDNVRVSIEQLDNCVEEKYNSCCCIESVGRNSNWSFSERSVAG